MARTIGDPIDAPLLGCAFGGYSLLLMVRSHRKQGKNVTR